MTQLIASFWVIVRMAMRNLVANRWKTMIAGTIIGAGAFIGVFGASILDAVDQAMRGSIIGSVTGHIQVYSSESTGELDVMSGGSASADIAPLVDFARVRSMLLAVPNVSAVVPMAIGSATVTVGNAADQALARLRQSVVLMSSGAAGPAAAGDYEARRSHVQRIVATLRADAEAVNEARVFTSSEMEALRTASAPAFWQTFTADPLAHLETLENRIAPLVSDSDTFGLQYLGTDPAAFARSFERMAIVDGNPIPPGERGFLFSKLVYEEEFKLRAARGLDKIRSSRVANHSTIADDPELKRIVHENASGIREILLQLDEGAAAQFRAKLQKLLQTGEADLDALMAAYFDMGDSNFEARYRFFYRELAPLVQLYRVRIGDTVTVKAFTRGGYVRSAALRVYGTYSFRGLENSPQSGALNLMDLVSFRELYGFVTAEGLQEIAAIRASAGARDLGRKDVEAELFGAGAVAEPELPAAARAPVEKGPDATRLERPTVRASYSPDELTSGLVLNAAVIVADESLIPETIRAIEAAGARGALPLKAVSWQQAAGFIGQFASLMRIVLFSSVFVILVVSLVVINNSLIMATLDRVREIGTLRAIGAQKTWILALLIAESSVVGLLSGGLGASLAAGCVVLLGRSGIPASSDVLTFFFSGPRLFPSVAAQSSGLVLSAVLGVGAVSGLYPAWVAMRVSPREAMRSEE